MNILFCGTCLPRIYEANIKDLSAAGNQYQNNLVKNLSVLGEVKVLTYINIDVSDMHLNILEDCKKDSIDCVFADKNKILGLIKYREKLKEYSDWADVIITYNVLYPWFGIGKIAKRKGKKSVAIVADYTPPVEHKTLARKIYALGVAKEFNKYQKIVMLSPEVSKYLRVENERVTINGCIDYSNFEDFELVKDCTTYKIVYSGLLSKITGVDLLLNAFKRIHNPNAYLYISGKGELEEYVINAAKEDSRIIFKGFLNQSEYINLLKSAHILINPRNMNYIQNQTNFPSKVLEYLASGKVIISTEFNGFEKYNENMYFVESDAEKLATCISYALEKYKENAQNVFELNRKKAKTLTWENQIKLFI